MSDTKPNERAFLKSALSPAGDCPGLTALAGADLSPDIQRHVSGCSRCRTELAMLREFENGAPNPEEAAAVHWIHDELLRRAPRVRKPHCAPAASLADLGGDRPLGVGSIFTAPPVCALDGWCFAVAADNRRNLFAARKRDAACQSGASRGLEIGTVCTGLSDWRHHATPRKFSVGERSRRHKICRSTERGGRRRAMARGV